MAASANLLAFRGQALATSFQIESPADGTVIQNSNIVMIEVTAKESQPGTLSRVEISMDGASWELAERSPQDADHWRFFLPDPSAGHHEIRARAVEIGGASNVSASASIEVRDGWTLPFAIDNRYAVQGQFRKGQLHTHSTFSFDGWASMHPGDLAQAYQRRGYSFAAITDHDVVSNPQELNSDSFVVIPAYESTADTGHITGLFAHRVVPPDEAAQARLNFIRDDGGMAILNHPTWQVGWSGTDLRTLQGCFAVEVFNGMTSTDDRAVRAIRMWHDLLNARGYGSRLWAVAVDDAHNPEAMDRGWVMVKTPALNQDAIRTGLQGGAFYASNGPSFDVLGVMNGAITATSRDAATIRFIDQDMNLVSEASPHGGAYLPTGTEKWVRVEAVAGDGRTAWSQPFWLLPNGAPQK